MNWPKENWKKIFRKWWFWTVFILAYFFVDSLRRGIREDVVFFLSLGIFIAGLYMMFKDDSEKEGKRNFDASANGMVLLILAYLIALMR